MKMQLIPSEPQYVYTFNEEEMQALMRLASIPLMNNETEEDRIFRAKVRRLYRETFKKEKSDEA